MKVQRRVQAAVNVKKMQIERLLRSISIDHEHEFFKLSPAYVNGVPHVARRVRATWRLPMGPITNLTRVVENAGGIVVLMDFGTKLIDGTHFWINGLPPIFFMNKHVSGDRYRYSLAHEVGHAVMHSVSFDADMEDQADRFASELLMPRAEIRTDLRGLRLDTAAELKPFWKVSMQALIMRAHQIGQISDAAKRRLFTQMSANGDRTVEPFPIEKEQPETFAELVDLHQSELELTEFEMRRLLFTDHLDTIEPPRRRGPRIRIAKDPTLFD